MGEFADEKNDLFQNKVQRHIDATCYKLLWRKKCFKSMTPMIQQPQQQQQQLAARGAVSWSTWCSQSSPPNNEPDC